MRAALAAVAFAVTACGAAPVAALPHFPIPVVSWSVSADRRTATCWERPEGMSIDVFSAGYFCWSECALVYGVPRAVMLDVAAEPDGTHFVEASDMRLYTGDCFTEVECPTCRY